MSVCTELELTCTARQSGEKVVESREWEQPYSEQQCSAKSSTLLLLLAFPGRGGTARKQREAESAELSKGVENTHTHRVQISHQSWPDFFPLLSLLCPSWRRFPRLSYPFAVSFKNFTVLETTSLLSRARSCQKKHTTQRGWSVRQPSRVK